MTDTTPAVAATSTRRTGTPTRIASVEDQLTALWRQTVGGDEGSVADDAVLRATTLNLLIHTNALDATLNTLEQLAELHPCRAIVLAESADPTDQGPLLATPSLLLRPAFGREMRSQVMCEVITLKDGREAPERLASAALGLTLADLSTVLWKFWDNPVELLADDPIIKTLAHALDGLIIDSAGVDEAEHGLQAISALHDELLFRTGIYDLNWARLQGWRRALAQQFDPLNDRAALRSAVNVEIEHHAAYQAAALLLGWLIDRLGWQLIEPGDRPNSWTVRSPEGPSVTLHIIDGTPGAEANAEGVYRITIKSASQTHSAEYISADSCFALISDDQRAVLASAALDNPALVNLTLDERGRDALYERALAQAIQLNRQNHSGQQGAALVVADNANALSQDAAREVARLTEQAIKDTGRFTLALSGGSTPRALYKLLAAEPYRTELPWSQIHIFWGDERDVPPDHPDSNQRMAQEALLSHVPIPPGNIHRILVGQLNAKDAAARYAAEIRAFFDINDTELPRFDLVLLGLGDDGHTASLFPHTEALNAAGTALFVANPVPQLNTTRLTLTADVINNAAHVIFLVSGEKKADILYEIMRGPYRPDDRPSQRIHPTHGTLTVMADQAAAARVQKDVRK